MNNITIGEWEKLRDLSIIPLLRTELPLAQVEESPINSGISVRLGDCRASIDLELAKDDRRRALAPTARFSMPATGSPFEEAKANLNVASRLLVGIDVVVNVLRYKGSWPRRVWTSDCPCDYCGGSGTVREEACWSCRGRGVRDDPPQGA